MNHVRSSVHAFANLMDAPFPVNDYSRLKFGSDIVARRFGYQLADDLFIKHADALLARPVVVIPSPFNYVKNAATIMTYHFVNRLNELLVGVNGNNVECDLIKRLIGYTADYGFLSADKRKGLLDRDTFFMNREFWADKTLVFVDDVRITGTHEDKLVEMLAKHNVPNDAFFIYFAEYLGNNPQIEAELNFAAVKSLEDYATIAREPGHHTIVRPIKYLLAHEDKVALRVFLTAQPRAMLERLYHNALGEGYSRIPGYQSNLRMLKTLVS